MATSTMVFVFLVVCATMVPISVFAWVAGTRRDKVRSAHHGIHRSVELDAPEVRRREAWADEAAAGSAERGHRRVSGRPQHGACLNGTPSAATRRRIPLNSSTTQWDRADTMNTVSQAPRADVNAERKERQGN
jgi:hypothetical protein